MDTYQPIRELIERVRGRWRLLRLFRSAARGAAGASAVLATGLVAAQWTGRSPLALIALVGVSAVLAAGVLVWALLPVRQVPTNRRVARFIEARARARRSPGDCRRFRRSRADRVRQQPWPT